MLNPFGKIPASTIHLKDLFRMQPNLLVSVKRLVKASFFVVVFLLLTRFGAFAGETEAAEKPAFWLWAFLGRLHPMVVHFPVGLLVVALIMEIIAWKRKKNFQASIQTLIVIGAISALVSVVMGLLLANTEDYGSDLLDLHQWTGIATMVLSVVTAVAWISVCRQMR